MFVLLALAVALSNNRRAISLRTVVPAFLLQVTMAALILYVPGGERALTTVSNAVQHVIDYAVRGSMASEGERQRQNPAP